MASPTLPASFAEGFTVSSTKGMAISAYRVLSATGADEGPADEPDDRSVDGVDDEAAPALIFAHANGFNAGCYLPLLQRLSVHFQVFAYDARGHGASPSPGDDIENDYAMIRFAEDLGAVTDAVRLMIGTARPLHFASHSLGGLAAILLEAALGRAPFHSLTLFEPPIYPPDGHPERAAALAHAPNFIRWAARRRNHFPDRAALGEETQKIITYRRFAPDMKAAYLEAAVEANPNGGFSLRCPGDIESAIYGNCPDSGIFEMTAKVATPARIYATDQSVLADLHSWAPGTMASIAANMPRGEARTMPGCLHLMAQEDPDACAAAIVDHALGR